MRSGVMEQWEVRRNQAGRLTVGPVGRAGNVIPWVEDEEVANLIAAAPRMLEALRSIANGEGAYGAQAYEYKQIARAALPNRKLRS